MPDDKGARMTARVLVSARNVRLVLDEYDERLRGAGVELVFPDTPQVTLTEAQLLEMLPGCIAAVSMPDAYTARVIASASPTLRLIARSGVGYDSIDLDAARMHGVWVTTTVGSNHDAVADYTLGLILDLARRITETVQSARGGAWQRFPGFELRGKVLGIVGTGRVGREVAARAKGFGLEVVAYDPFPNHAWAESAGVTYLEVDELFAQARIVTLHAPSMASTRHLVNAARLASMPEGGCLINTARGELVDEAALLAALDAGRMWGAALDVVADEPPTSAQAALIAHPKVITTSHCAGAAVEANTRAAAMCLDEVLRVVGGEAPLHVVPELR
jgi:phosphoglycerate dehydrogenase-like enzyme